MTPTELKVKEIALQFIFSTFHQMENENLDKDFDKWLPTVEAQKLIGELGSDWISVKDRMPNELTLVLVSNGKEVKEASWQKRTDNDKYHFMWTTMKDITHWKPLPQPPKT